MLIGILLDIHSNYYALKSVLNKAKKSIGIVTEQDVVLAIKTFKQKILELKITEIMSVDLN